MGPGRYGKTPAPAAAAMPPNRRNRIDSDFEIHCRQRNHAGAKVGGIQAESVANPPEAPKDKFIGRKPRSGSALHMGSLQRGELRLYAGEVAQRSNQDSAPNFKLGLGNHEKNYST